MAGFLQQVMAERRADARAALARTPWPELLRQARNPRTPHPFPGTAQPPCLIAEVKKASPSAGCLRPDYRPAELASAYAQAGAAAISVLTEPRHFLGSADDLRAVRQAVSLPILRKDFISEPCQVAETALLGADLVLLIAAALPPPRLAALAKLARELGLQPLVETHDRAELETAAALPEVLIGVNSRNLATLQTDLATARQLAAALPSDRFCLAESGLRTAAEIRELQALGYRGFLVGETLLRANDPVAQLRALRGMDTT